MTVYRIINTITLPKSPVLPTQTCSATEAASSTQIKRSVQLFGRLGVYGNSVEIDHTTGVNAKQVRDIIIECLSRIAPESDTNKLCCGSILAGEEAILHDDDIVPDSGALSLLPPVSGG